MLINVTGGEDITLFEVDEAANRIRKEVDNEDTNVIFGSTFDEKLKGRIRVSIVATGIDARPTSPRVILPQKAKLSVSTKVDVQQSEEPQQLSWMKKFMKKFIAPPKKSQPVADKPEQALLEENIYKVPSYMRRKNKESMHE